MSEKGWGRTDCGPLDVLVPELQGTKCALQSITSLVFGTNHATKHGERVFRVRCCGEGTMAGWTKRGSARSSMALASPIFARHGSCVFCHVFAILLCSESQTAVRGMLHRDPSAALRKSLEDPPILCKDEAVKVRRLFPSSPRRPALPR